MIMFHYSLAMPEYELSNSPFAFFSVVDFKVTPMKGETHE
jgi:hypothetical protein